MCIRDSYHPDKGMRDPTRHQWNGDLLLERLRRACVETSAECEGAYVLGVTPLDLYLPEKDWRFALAVRNKDVAIVSSARMHGVLEGTVVARMKKMVAKTIALEYCGSAPSSDPRSIRYDRILATGDLDALDVGTW